MWTTAVTRLAITVAAIYVLCAITVGAQTHSSGQSPAPAQLQALEDSLAKKINEIRTQAGAKPLGYRRDIRVRREACSVAVKGPDGIVEPPKANPSLKRWYVGLDPNHLDAELSEIAASVRMGKDHFGVGVWFAANEKYPNGAYWVVVIPEHSALHEAVWGHFYLTDDFEYQTPFGNFWKQELPDQCRGIR